MEISLLAKKIRCSLSCGVIINVVKKLNSPVEMDVFFEPVETEKETILRALLAVATYKIKKACVFVSRLPKKFYFLRRIKGQKSSSRTTTFRMKSLTTTELGTRRGTDHILNLFSLI